MAGTPIEHEKKNGSTYEKAVKGHTGLFAVWAIGDPGTAAVVVRIFSRITRDDVGGVCFSPYSAARMYTSPCPSPSSHLPCSTQTIDFEKNLVPGELWYAQHQLIELTTRSMVHHFEDSVSKSS